MEGQEYIPVSMQHSLFEQTLSKMTMSHLDPFEQRLMRRRLLEKERQMNDEKIAEAMQQGVPLPRLKPRGSILNLIDR